MPWAIVDGKRKYIKTGRTPGRPKKSPTTLTADNSDGINSDDEDTHLDETTTTADKDKFETRLLQTITIARDAQVGDVRQGQLVTAVERFAERNSHELGIHPAKIIHPAPGETQGEEKYLFRRREK